MSNVARLLASLAKEASLSKGVTFYEGNAETKLCQLRAELAPLAARYDVVVANPPYMGGKNMDHWLGSWIKKNYPDVKGDLCTCFIQRVLGQLHNGGYAGLATSNSWMFLSSYEKLRKGIIEKHNIATLVQLSVHGFRGIAAQVCTFVLSKEKNAGMKGGYVRLNDFDHHSLQEEKTLEALADPGCGWFYRVSAEDYGVVPGIPIAYWSGRGIRNAFENKTREEYGFARSGVQTGDNNLFLKYWQEVDYSDISFDNHDKEAYLKSGRKWVPQVKGGEYRKWYGNFDYVINGRMMEKRSEIAQVQD